MATDSKLYEQRNELVDYIIDEVLKDNKHLYDEGLHLSFLQHNPSSNCIYKGSNQTKLALIALKNGYSDPRWLTFNQAKKLGYKIKAGSHGVQIENWRTKTLYKDVLDDKGKPVLDDKGLPQKESYTVLEGNLVKERLFNASQIEGIPPLESTKLSDEDKITELETILAHSEAPIYFDQRVSNFYSPKKDEIHLAKKEHFKSMDHMYATALHEIGHSTGHSTRLNRLDEKKDMSFGSKAYVEEELVAEFSAAILNEKYNLPFSEAIQKDSSTEYIRSWYSLVKENPTALFAAAKKAQQAVEHIEKNMLTPYLQKESLQKESTLGISINYINGRDMDKNEQQSIVLGGGLHSFANGSVAREYIKSQKLSVEEEASMYGGHIYKTGEIYTGDTLHQLLSDIAKDDISSHVNKVGLSHDVISLIPFKVNHNGVATPLKDSKLNYTPPIQLNLGQNNHFNITSNSTSNDIMHNLLVNNRDVEASHLIPKNEFNEPLALSSKEAFQTLLTLNESTPNYYERKDISLDKSFGMPKEDIKVLDSLLKERINQPIPLLLDQFNKKATVPLPLTKASVLDFNNKTNIPFIEAYNELESRAIKELSDRHTKIYDAIHEYKYTAKDKEIISNVRKMLSNKFGMAIEFAEGSNKTINGKNLIVLGGGENSFAYGSLPQQIIKQQNLTPSEEATMYGGHVYELNKVYTGEHLKQLIADLSKDDITSHVNQCGTNKVFLNPYLVKDNGDIEPILKDNRKDVIRIDIGDGSLISKEQTPKEILVQLMNTSESTKKHVILVDLSHDRFIDKPIKLSTTPKFKTLLHLNENIENLMVSHHKGTIPRSLAELDSSHIQSVIKDLEAGKDAKTIAFNVSNSTLIPKDVLNVTAPQLKNRESNKEFIATYESMKADEKVLKTTFTINGKRQVNLKGEVLDAPLKQVKENGQPLPKELSKPMYDEPVRIDKPKAKAKTMKERYELNKQQRKLEFDRSAPSIQKGRSLERKK